MMRCEACGTDFEDSHPVNMELAGKVRDLCFECSTVLKDTGAAK